MKKLLAIILSLMLLGSIALAETPLYDYLTDLFLKVYTNSEFESMTGQLYSRLPRPSRSVLLCRWVRPT